jgi:hypothetical protein
VLVSEDAARSRPVPETTPPSIAPSNTFTTEDGRAPKAATIAPASVAADAPPWAQLSGSFAVQASRVADPRRSGVTHVADTRRLDDTAAKQR